MTAEKPHFYPKTDANPNFPEIEEQVLAFWDKHRTFEASVDQRPSKIDGQNNEFIFYDGPPFANGLPHYGHLLTGFVKDLFARYQTVKGKRVERRFGWDCHGLPAEMSSEKELQVSGRAQIMDYGIDKFNEHCRTSVMKYTQEWRDYVTRQARWVDFDNDYKTMDFSFMESVIWAFKQLHEKGLIYEAYRVMPYSWAAETPLSNFETRLDNSYRERTDKAVTVAFELEERPEGAPEGCDKYYILAWTTTPWTLPSNLALAVSGKMDYVAVVKEQPAPSSHRLRGELEGGGKVNRDPKLETRAKELRQNPTEAEKHLWQKLRAKQLDTKFRRQHVIDNYIVDFVNMESRLIIELDGGQHAEQQDYDEQRTNTLKSLGFRVIRFWNNDVLQNMEGVLLQILDALSLPPLAPPASGLGDDAPSVHEKVCYIFGKFAEPKYLKELDIAPAGWVGVKFDQNGNPISDPTDKDQQDVDKKATNHAEYTRTFEGSSLIDAKYKPLFPYFKDHPNAFQILDGSDFVEEGSGTGIVHMAPGFGEDDQRVCEDAGISVVCPVDGAGKYTNEIFDLYLTSPDGRGRHEVSGEGQSPIGDNENRELPHPTPLPEREGIALSLKGLNVLEATDKDEDEPFTPEQLKKYGLANLRIINWLKLTGKLVHQEDYPHNYPHCWRTDKPLIYKAVPSWYVEVTKFRDRMVQLNHEQINWIPSHVRDGLFGKWLEGARDWSISRNRFWGSPIPVWKSNHPDNKELYVFGSAKELEEFFGKEVKDLHRPYIDELTKPDPLDPQYTISRVEEVFDCWFESGSMPYAQVHYPFENKEWFDTHNPADFIVEYTAQTRGWFYTMMVLGTALFDRPPFLNCICHGVVLDANGQKLSKSLRNYPDPSEITDKHGADALRWFMMSSPIMRGLELHIDKEGNFIRDAVRLYVKPIWNAYNFFCLYANADGVQGKLVEGTPEAVMDRYILSKLRVTVNDVEKALDSYDTPSACQAVSSFFEVLNNWYIRRNRSRFWGSDYSTDKQAAYDTLFTVLHVMCRVASPLLPLVTEAIYRGLNGAEAASDCSVHLADWPDANALPNDITLVNRMDWVQDACNSALSIRSKQNVRIRQPLESLTIVADKETVSAILNDSAKDVYFSIIEDELNVKSVSWSAEGLDSLAELKLNIQFPIVGKRLPEKMKDIIKASKTGEWKQLPSGELEISGERLTAEEYTLRLDPKTPDCAAPLSTNDALVVLDLTITPELAAEGVARDVVRLVQQARKDAGLDVSDRIHLAFQGTDNVMEAVTSFKDYIAEQTLALDVLPSMGAGVAYRTTQKLEGHDIEIGITKAA